MSRAEEAKRWELDYEKAEDLCALRSDLEPEIGDWILGLIQRELDLGADLRLGKRVPCRFAAAIDELGEYMVLGYEGSDGLSRECRRTVGDDLGPDPRESTGTVYLRLPEVEEAEAKVDS